MATTPLVMERSYAAPADAVWKALTDPAKMKEWYFDVPGFRPQVGFEFTFDGLDKQGKVKIHLCKVTEVIPERKLSYIWKYKDHPGESLLTFELFPEGDQTRLKLTHSGLETFPQDSTGFAVENFVEGWTYILGTSLANYLAK